MSDATKRVTFESKHTTIRTVEMFKEARRLYTKWGGHGTIQIVQGGYNAGGVKASAGTHDRDALDISIRFLSGKDKGLAVRAMRTVGFACWHRYTLPGTWVEHGHGVPKGGDLSRGAAAQVTSFRNGRNGLVGNAKDSSIGKYAKVTWESYKASQVKTKKLSKPTTYYVTSKTLRGRSESGQVKVTRKRGFAITVTKLVTRDGQTWAVSNHNTWYLTKYGKDTYLSTKKPASPKPAPKPAAPKPAPARAAVLRASVASWWPATAKRFEGRLTGMYLDTKGLVTTGTGNLLEPVSKALELDWFKADGKKASDAEVRAEWAAIKARKSLASKGGYAYVKYQKLHLTEAGVSALLVRKTNEFVAAFAKQWKDFASWPASAQAAALDLMWQNGPSFATVKDSKGRYVWANTHAAFAKQDWAAAAKAVPGSVTSPRRLMRVRLFTNAAAVKAWKLDASVLYDTTKPVKPAPAPAPVKQAVAVLASVAAAAGGTAVSQQAAPPAPVPAVSSASPTPAPTVTVTAKPKPAPTVTITAKPKPAEVKKKTVYACKAACVITIEPKKK